MILGVCLSDWGKEFLIGRQKVVEIVGFIGDESGGVRLDLNKFQCKEDSGWGCFVGSWKFGGEYVVV